MIRVRRSGSIAAIVIGALIAGASIARADLLYSNTSLLYTDTQQTQPAGVPVGTGGTPILLDDVLIPDYLLHPTLPLPVTKVTFGILRAPNAPAVDITGYWASLVEPVADNSDENGFPLLNTPLNSLGSVHLDALTSSSTTLQIISFGNGTDTLFTVASAMDDPFAPGYGEFAAGLSMSAATNSNLWALIDPNNLSAENGDFVWPASDVNTIGDAANLSIPDPNNPGQFIPVYSVMYMQIDGVPEPASAALIGAGIIAGLMRRRAV